MNKLWVIIIVLIVLLIFWSSYAKSENFIMRNHLKGKYQLIPKFSDNIKANRAISVQINPEVNNLNPNYVDLMVDYANGKSNMVRTNFAEGNIFTYYNDLNNVLYREPSNIWYDLHTDTGLFRALTVVVENGMETLKLLPYQIVQTAGLKFDKDMR
jgi:hypothetical protein